MSSEPSKLYLNWEQVQRDGELLADKLRDKGPWTGIVAVARGGLNPALTLATELDIRLIETFCIVSYDENDKQGDAAILKGLEHLGDGSGWLVVDDLVDSGKTYDIIRGHLPKAHFSCLYGKPNGIPSTDTYVVDVPQDTWVFFPWELKADAPEKMKLA
jgi:xanthine phosphoribosyltransferase